METGLHILYMTDRSQFIHVGSELQCRHGLPKRCDAYVLGPLFFVAYNSLVGWTIMENKWSVSGAGRKLGERERSGERRSHKTMERERGFAERERNGERFF